MNKKLCRFTLSLLVCFSVLSTAAAQVEISAVPSTNTPPVGYQIEVSINIAGGSNVGGYDFTLTFNPSELEFISIENADYLPGSVRDLTELESISNADLEALSADVYTTLVVGDGAVRFAAVAETIRGEGNGTLAIARFKVLVETETTIGLEDVVIGDRAAQPIELTITDAPITPIAAGDDVEYFWSIPSGYSLIHVPLKVTTVDRVARNITSIGDVYDALGGANTVKLLLTFDSQTQEAFPYILPSDRGTRNDRELTDDMGIFADMKVEKRVRLTGRPLGTNGSSTITINSGLNFVGLPLNDSSLTHVSDLLTLPGIAGNAPVVIFTDSGEIKVVPPGGGPDDTPLIGGQGFILDAQRAAPVIIAGDGWTNTSGTAAAPPVAMRGIEVGDTMPVLVLRGAVIDNGRGLSNTNFRVIAKNRSTGRSVATVTGGEYQSRSNMWGSGGIGYQLTDVDLETKRAATIGDILEISAQSSHPLIVVEPLQYTVTAEDVRQGWIQLPALVAYEIPAETALLHNYPNPFNPETWIPYQLAHAAEVTLTIYDIQGVLIRQLDLGHQQAGYYTNRTRAAYWDGRNHLGEAVGSGVYFYHLRAGDYSTLRKMVILK